MGFDFNNTCPQIDDAIYRTKECIESDLEDMLEECCPLLKDTQLKTFIASYTDTLYNNLDSYFEDVRRTNEKMREEAEYQIDILEEKIKELEEEVECPDKYQMKYKTCQL